MQKAVRILVILSFAVSGRVAASTEAQGRLATAQRLQDAWDASPAHTSFKMAITFRVRGMHCDVLHVDTLNFEEGMMSGLANGTWMSGTWLRGTIFTEGVNRFAFSSSFRDVVYTSHVDAAFLSFGPSNIRRKQVKDLALCNEKSAVSASENSRHTTVPESPRFELLSWRTASPGRKLYGGGSKHEATIVSVDRSSGLITVKYVRNGAIEQKLLDAVSRYWYITK
jgi:hypothetical protein